MTVSDECLTSIVLASMVWMLHSSPVVGFEPDAWAPAYAHAVDAWRAAIEHGSHTDCLDPEAQEDP